MSVAEELTKLANTKESIRQAINQKGGNLDIFAPFSVYAQAIENLSGGIPGPDPTIPTIANIKKALKTGQPEKYYPVGTIIDDMYLGASNPLIVVQYRQVTTAYGEETLAAFLQRTYVTNNQSWGSNNTDYGTASVNSFLQGTYFDNCSNATKNSISKVKIPVVTSAGQVLVSGYWFLPSVEEMYGLPPTAGQEGNYFEYWKTKTGLASPSNSNHVARSIPFGSSAGSGNKFWLRTRAGSNNQVWKVGVTGDITSGFVSEANTGVLPYCVVVNTALDDFKEALDAGTASELYPVGTEIPDDYDGENNPLIVAQYLDETNNSAYGGENGVILMRKYSTVPLGVFGSTGKFSTSTFYNNLKTVILPKCSNILQGLISPLTIKPDGVSSPIEATIFAPSLVEVGGSAVQDGFFWDYWKQRLGISSPDANPKNARIIYDSAGTAQPVWLRTTSSTVYNYRINNNGSTSTYNAQATSYCLSCFFIKKGA